MEKCETCVSKPYRKKLCRSCYMTVLSTKNCEFFNCANKTHRKNGLCNKHHDDKRFAENRKIPCSECGEPSLMSGLCNWHYRRKINSFSRERENASKYRLENPEKAKECVKKWHTENVEYMREYSRNYMKKRRKNDINFKLREFARRQAWRVMKGLADETSLQLLGCDETEFKSHIESMFQDGMGWDNWGPRGWHIDHIKPLSGYDLTNEDQLAKACHYTNLQPMWWIDNLRKGGAK